MTATKVRVPAGLSIVKHWDGWQIIHTRSRLPVHKASFHLKADATEAAIAVGPLLDWDQDKVAVLGVIDVLPGGRAAMSRLLMPPEERERRRRVWANATRHLRALEAAGERVTKRTSHGLAGTVYTMSCGCERIFGLAQLFTPDPDPEETLAAHCDKHTGLTVDPEPTDRETIVRDLRRAKGTTG